MSAQELREAAALMRSRAEAATPSPWARGGNDIVGEDDFQPYVAATYLGQRTTEANAQHIASWHPVIALKVAAALDSAAAILDESRDGPLDMAMRAIAEPLVDVARAYVGGDQ